MSIVNISVNINAAAGKRLLEKGLAEALRIGIAAVGALQLEQVSDAFRNSGQPILKWPRLWADQVPGSHRSGGQPLRDTGTLEASFGVPQTEASELTATSTITSGVPYAAFHQTGFQTKGPNFIPLSRRAQRLHRPGANPKDEGLALGIDYVMAWKGVTVPARPMIDYNDPINKNQMNDAMADGLQASFGG